jgi:hypothetical protein
MMHKVTRRDALQLALVAGAIPYAWNAGEATGQASTPAPPPAIGNEGDGLTSYIKAGRVAIRWNNSIIADYRTSPLQKYPYFSQLAGPLTGIPLTSESSLPFPHHRGLWLGCDPLNGGDYWTDAELETGQIRSLDLQLGETTANSVEIRNRCQWVRRGAASPFIDERHIVFRLPSAHIRLIDFDIKMTALEPISITKAKHSFFALRVAPDLSPLGGGNLVNSSGDIGESGTFGKPANWCSYYGKRRGLDGNIVEGIAVMNHPKNPWHRCPWFTRDYGHLSPSPFNFLARPWELRESESIRLRYRVALHAGTPSEARLDRLYEEWIGA